MNAESIDRLCALCREPITHRRADGTSPRHCGKECARRAVLADERMRAYGDIANPWSLSSPPYGPHLPGRLCEMVVVGERREHCALAGSTVAHGIAATLTRHPHDPHQHHHALWPDPLGERWWVLMPEESAKYVASRRFVHAVAQRTAEVRFGPAITMRTPAPVASGRHRIAIETQTPVVIRSSGGEVTRIDPDAGNIASTLGGLLTKRLGLTEVPPHLVELRLLNRETRPWIGLIDRGRRIGGDGRIRGWHGIVRVECSGLTAWLLRCAEIMGLGGRTGYGFGRVRLTHE